MYLLNRIKAKRTKQTSVILDLVVLDLVLFVKVRNLVKERNTQETTTVIAAMITEILILTETSAPPPLRKERKPPSRYLRVQRKKHLSVVTKLR